MIAAVVERLKTALVVAGIPERQVIVGAAGLSQLKVKPRAVVHFHQTEEQLRRDGSMVGYRAEDGKRYYRRRLYRRELEVMVQIEADTQAGADEHLVRALVDLRRGFLDANGNWIAIGDVPVGRIEDKGQTAAVNTAVAVILFIGGIYDETPANIATDMATEGTFVEEL